MFMNKISRWLLWRELGNGELFLILVALWLAVSFSSGIALFADRLHKGLTAQSADLMGGDLILKSSQPLKPEWREKAKQLGLRTSELTEFSSMALAGDAMQLVSVKAVDAQYPLRGTLLLSSSNPKSATPVASIGGPAKGEIWVENRVWQALDLDRTEVISLGAMDFHVTQLIQAEPDRGADFMNFSPRVMINTNDLAATQLISVGSRIRWKLALAGEASQINQFAEWVKPLLTAHTQLTGVNNQRPVVQNTLIQAEKYLYLSGLLAVVLAGVAIGFSMRRYTQRQTDSIALMKSLGADSRQIRSILLSKFLLLSALAIALGVASGGLIQHFIIGLLKTSLPNQLPLPDSKPIWLASSTALLLIAGFAAPPLSQLIRTPAMRILKQSLPVTTPKQVLLYGSAAISLWLLMILYSQDIKLGSIVFISLLGLFAALTSITLLIIKLASSPIRKVLFRYPASTLAQTIGFSVTLWVIISIYFLRTEIIQNWKEALPASTPNYFAMNIQPDQKDGFMAKLKQAGFQSEALYPIIRGRLTSINERKIADESTAEESQNEGRDESLNRELNLTWSDTLPSDNQITEGDWWQNPVQETQDKLSISLEEKLAKRLNIKLGDQLTFALAGEAITATVVSLRSVKWESMHPNFYVIFEPNKLQNFPATYMTSFFVPESNKTQLTEFARQFSGVSLVDIEGVMNQVRSITHQVGSAIEAVMASILLMGVILLYSSILISLDERSQESALIRAFGGSRARVSLRIARELFANGLLAGLLAVMAAETSLYALSHWVFGLEYHPHLQVILILPFAAASVVMLVGAWAAWWLGRVPLNLLLKEASS